MMIIGKIHRIRTVKGESIPILEPLKLAPKKIPNTKPKMMLTILLIQVGLKFIE